LNSAEARKKISRGEGLHTECKASFSDNEEIAKYIVCFANTDGGQIYIGVDDNGTITGINNLDELTRKIDDIAFNRCEPPVTVVQETLSIDKKTILIINVSKGDQRPYRTSRGFYYIRSSNRCRKASREELLRLFQTTESIFYDEIEIARASVQDIDNEHAKSFIERYFDLEVNDKILFNYLFNIKALSRHKKPTLAGLLFFGKNSQFFIPYARVTGAYIKGNDISVPPSDKKDFEGKIPQILEDALRYLKIYVREKHIIKGMEPENYPEIEDFVLREALVNAIGHRDYTISAPVRILIFKNRIEFHTPGKLPTGVTIESIKIGGAHVLRNPTIYNFLRKMGVVTDIGSGVKRIIESVKKTTGKNVKFELTDGEFILTIPKKAG